MNTATSEGIRTGELADRTPISDIMTRDVVCVQAELSVESLTQLMLERGISGAPVVDARGRAIGVVSKTDLLRELHERGDTSQCEHEPPRIRRNRPPDLHRGFHVEELVHATAGEIMMPVAFTLSETAPISQAAALMAFEGVHRVPVLARSGEVVGIVSSLDVLRWLAEVSGYLHAPGS